MKEIKRRRDLLKLMKSTTKITLVFTNPKGMQLQINAKGDLSYMNFIQEFLFKNDSLTISFHFREVYKGLIDNKDLIIVLDNKENA